MKDLRGLLSHIIQNPQFNNATIAGQLLMSKTTVGKYRRLVEQHALSIEKIAPMTDSALKALFTNADPTVTAPEPHWDNDVKDIARGWRRSELWKRYREANPGVKTMEYRTYCERIGLHVIRTQPTMKLVHVGGEVMMTDYAGYRPEGLCSGTALPRPFELYVAV